VTLELAASRQSLLHFVLDVLLQKVSGQVVLGGKLLNEHLASLINLFVKLFHDGVNVGARDELTMN